MYNGKHTKHSAKRFRKSRRRAGIVTLSLLLLLTFAIGGTLAYLIADTGPLVNTFTPSKVTVEVTEDFDGETKSQVNVKNTGDIAAWVRIKLVSYWVNADGQIIGGTAEIPSFTPGEGWATKDGYYYYTSPVAPGKEPATDLISSIELQVKTETVSGTDNEGNPTTSTEIVEKQVIEVIAEGVQSVPEDAVRDAWGFVPSASAAN